MLALLGRGLSGDTRRMVLHVLNASFFRSFLVILAFPSDRYELEVQLSDSGALSGV